MINLPKEFLESFVKKGIRERIAHEWKKKPQKLLSRICHEADTVFLDGLVHDQKEFNYDTVSINDGDKVIVFQGSIRETTYEIAKRELEKGFGVLIITVDGNEFIAETEACPGFPYEIYAGRANKAMDLT